MWVGVALWVGDGLLLADFFADAEAFADVGPRLTLWGGAAGTLLGADVAVDGAFLVAAACLDTAVVGEWVGVAAGLL